jgi:hypothetical protein
VVQLLLSCPPARTCPSRCPLQPLVCLRILALCLAPLTESNGRLSRPHPPSSPAHTSTLSTISRPHPRPDHQHKYRCLDACVFSL